MINLLRNQRKKNILVEIWNSLSFGCFEWPFMIMEKNKLVSYGFALLSDYFQEKILILDTNNSVFFRC